MTSARRSFEVALAASLTLVGCNRLGSIKIQPPSSVLVGRGKTVQLRVQELDTDGKELSQKDPVAWVTDSPIVATVDGSGMVTGLKSGKATLSAAVGSFKSQATIEVHVPAAIAGQDVALSGIGTSSPLTLSVTDENNQPVPGGASLLKVVSGDTKVATIAGPGRNGWTATATGPGQTKIIASLGPLTQTMSVQVSAPSSAVAVSELKVNPSTLKMKVGQKEKLTVTAMAGAAAAPAGSVKFASTNTKVASVAADGTVSAAARGQATISLTAGAKTASVAVVVAKK